MCNTGVYPTHVLHVLNMYITHVSATHLMHLYFVKCNTPKTPQMYYRFSTTGHVKQI